MYGLKVSFILIFSFPLTFISSSLLYPNRSNRCWNASWLRPSLVHLRCSKTSSRGIFSCMNQLPLLPNSHWISKRKKRRKKIMFLSLSFEELNLSTRSMMGLSSYQINSFLVYSLVEGNRLLIHLEFPLDFTLHPEKLWQKISLV